MKESDKNDNVFAIQFNGWNYGAINDWVYNERGLYPAAFKSEFELGYKTVHKNDWVVKEDSGRFSVMSNLEFQERMDKTKQNKIEKDMSKKVLVVVDVQKDFYHPDGALYVKGGEALPGRIAKVIPQFDGVIFTVDWHPYKHCSFKENGGTWPTHCVAYTEGSSLPDEFKPYIIAERLCANVVTKGSLAEFEEYGANIFVKDVVDEVVFSGVAGEYCVLETIKIFIKRYPKIKVKVYLDGVASIDDGTTIREFMKENNIEEWIPTV